MTYGQVVHGELADERGMTPITHADLRGDWRYRGIFLGLVIAILVTGTIWLFHRFKLENPPAAAIDPIPDNQSSRWARRFGDRPLIPRLTSPIQGVGIAGPIASVNVRPHPTDLPQFASENSQAAFVPPAGAETPQALHSGVAPSSSNAFDAPVMVAGFDRNAAATRVPSELGGKDSTTAGKASDPNSVAALLEPERHEGVQASRLSKRSMLLATGSTIECALQTHLDSTLPGLTSCVVTHDVYSDDGRVILIERGSLVTGEYRSSVGQGQNRIFVVWTRLKTPLGIVINLDSPATDPLGGSGIPADVNEHWFDRIGAAFLLSFIQDGIALEETSSQRAGAGNQTVVLPNTNETGNRMADRVLDHTIELPTTLSKNQGARINIFVARDLYFDAVYELAVD